MTVTIDCNIQMDIELNEEDFKNIAKEIKSEKLFDFNYLDCRLQDDIVCYILDNKAEDIADKFELEDFYFEHKIALIELAKAKGMKFD